MLAAKCVKLTVYGTLLHDSIRLELYFIVVILEAGKPPEVHDTHLQRSDKGDCLVPWNYMVGY
jgi:hypothetical protein